MSKELTIVSVEIEPELTLDELCQSYQISPDFIQELIIHGAIDPMSVNYQSLKFDSRNQRRIARVIRLQHDLEVNVPGAALALDLMEQIDQLKSQVDLLEKYLLISGK